MQKISLKNQTADEMFAGTHTSQHQHSFIQFEGHRLWQFQRLVACSSSGHQEAHCVRCAGAKRHELSKREYRLKFVWLARFFRGGQKRITQQTRRIEKRAERRGTDGTWKRLLVLNTQARNGRCHQKMGKHLPSFSYVSRKKMQREYMTWRLL